ncbi:hypothetical protein [Moritella sp. F3]|uniref:hypothetical protein n=1 Tax=Moritella sp. F3 TaxID=2718882 RepID=UPI0018E19B5A|nr:hypothetical protein [Moritella sp. F3]GIC78691.1 hypothetical protein FMO001_34180 [Moritella sp. F1]GIC81381.1 hypothetical protein FMO003_16620 [Moritella sp. F3]
MEAEHVTQRYDDDCGVAAFATIARKTYEEADEIMKDVRQHKTRFILHRNMKFKLIQIGLLDINSSYSKKFLAEKGDAIIYARHTDGYWHYITFIGGVFYDPNKGQPSSKLDNKLIPSVVYNVDYN